MNVRLLSLSDRCDRPGRLRLVRTAGTTAATADRSRSSEDAAAAVPA